MVSLLIAMLLLAVCMAVYVFYRRGRHGGLAGGSGATQPPFTPLAGNEEAKMFTEEEVAKHNTSGDLWLIINGKVYDFTDYFLLHPGGEAILRNAGKDSTVGFSKSHHPARVWDMVRSIFKPMLA